MKRSWRLIVALLLLTVSLTLLVWGFWPMRRETLVTPVQPSNLSLPTPSSFFLELEVGPWSQA
jgi:hypothetical protein